MYTFKKNPGKVDVTDDNDLQVPEATSNDEARAYYSELGIAGASPSDIYPMEGSAIPSDDPTAPGQKPEDISMSTPSNGPPPEASEEEVLIYCRQMVEQHSVIPAPLWRRIRFELPNTIAELRLNHSKPEQVQYTEPVTPSPCLVLLLEGTRSEETTPKEYSVQLVKYLFQLMAFLRASTPITTLRFVKKGTELFQLVVTFGKDVRLATRVLEQLQTCGYPAGYGNPIDEYPPNATFQVTDYSKQMNGGKGISSQQVLDLLTPFKAPKDIKVIEGYDAGVFYVPVKRPESVFSWLWNWSCSFLVQQTLFERFGVLLTMAECHHEFLKKGIPFHLQKKEKEREFRKQKNRRAGEQVFANEDDGYDYGVDPDDAEVSAGEEEENKNMEGNDSVDVQAQPQWDLLAQEEVDIFKGIIKNKDEKRAGALHSQDDDPEMMLRDYNVYADRTDENTAAPASGPDQNTTENFFPTPVPSNPVGAANPASLNDMWNNRPPLPPNPAMEPWSYPSHGYDSYDHDPAAPLDYGNSMEPNWESAHSMQNFSFLPTQFDSEKGYPDSQIQHVKADADYPELVDDQEENEPLADAMHHLGSNNSIVGAPPYPYHTSEMAYSNQHSILGGTQDAFPSMEKPSSNPYYSPPTYIGSQHEGVAFGDPNMHSISSAILGDYHHAPPNSVPDTIYSSFDVVASQDWEAHHPNSYASRYRDFGGSIFRPPDEPWPQGDVIFPSFHAVSPADGEIDGKNKAVHPSARPLALTSESVDLLVARIEELVQAAFPAEYQLIDQLNDMDGKKKSPITETVAYDVSVPPPTDEIIALRAVIEQERYVIKKLLDGAAVEFESRKQRIIQLLLISLPVDSEKDDWTPKGEGNVVLETRKGPSQGSLEPVEATQAEAGEITEGMQLPSLFPYLLSSQEGIEVIESLICASPTRATSLMVRYILPFLLNASVVQSVCCLSLQCDAREGNAFVERILKHWIPLTKWLNSYIEHQARLEITHQAKESQGATSGLSSRDAVDSLDPETLQKTTAAKRLISQVGNRIDTLLSKMSAEQISFCKAFFVQECSLSRFAENKDLLRTLWGSSGAVHRTLLRLFINADILNGEEVVQTLFYLPRGDEEKCYSSLTRDHFYFLIVSVSKSLVSPTLSSETARMCGAFLHKLEHQLATPASSSSSQNKTDALQEKDAMQLLDAALRSTQFQSVYDQLRSTYFKKPSPPSRLPKVCSRLSELKLGNVENEMRHFSSTPADSSHRAGAYGSSSHRDGTYNDADKSRTLPNRTNVRNWSEDWSVTMRTYPMSGLPFPPLPTGWSSFLSRSYGHYYFRDSKGSATYRHPLQSTEFMVTPQAFLKEEGCHITLKSLLNHVNRITSESHSKIDALASQKAAAEKESPASIIITDEEAEKWLADQRIRNLKLDLGVLELLKITYRVGGINKRQDEHISKVPRKRSRSRSAEDQVVREVPREMLKVTAHYPPRDPPFPPLLYGWTSSISSSNGLYYFRPPRGDAVYRHPQNKREYRAAPQAFAFAKKIKLEDLLKEAKKSNSIVTIEEAKTWLNDQRQRHVALDQAVMNLAQVTYSFSEDIDDHPQRARQSHGEEGSRGSRYPRSTRVDRPSHPNPNYSKRRDYY